MRAFLIAFLVAVLGGVACGQSPTGTITGIAFDPDAKAVPSADIVVVNDLTGMQYEAKTNDLGIYTVTSLPPGLYRVQASKVGFKTLIRPDITVNVQDSITINFTLPIGATSVAITVEGGAPMLNTTDASLSTVVDRNFVENMPLNGRSFQDLILLTPGVVPSSPQTAQSLGGQGEFSVNGQRTESNYYSVDGVSANLGAYPGSPNSPGTGGSLPAATALGTTQALVSVDALQEFRVQSSTYSAEFGRNPGGQFSFVTRSGANEWHGTAFDYLRNNAFDANDWFNNYYALPASEERQNDFGGTLGGPIEIPRIYDGKDKSFFFFSYEGLRLIEPQPANVSYVPDAYLRACSPAALQPVLKAFPSNGGAATVDCSQPDPGSGLSEFIDTWSNPSSIDSTSIRFDQVIGKSLKAFFRFGNTPSASLTRFSSVPSTTSALDFTARTYTAALAASLWARVNNEFRFNYSSNDTSQSVQLDSFGGAQPVSLSQLQGIDTEANPAYAIGICLCFGGYPQLNQEKFRTLQSQWNLVDVLSVSYGRHQVKFGVDYRRLTPTVDQINPQVGYYYFSPASVLANQADSAVGQANDPAHPLYQNFSAFAQDDWRIRARLSLSLGIRWELDPAPGVTQGLKPYTLQGVGNRATMALAPQGTALWQTQYHNFAPRLGAAYILRTAAGFETVVRGGVGVFYDTAQQAGSQGFQGIGFGSYNFPVGNLSFPIAGLGVPPVVVNPPVPPYSSYTVYGFSPHLQLPYTLQTNFSVQQALGKNQSLTVSYVGAFARKLLETNSILVGPENPDFSGTAVVLLNNGLSSDYNALQVQFQRRLTTRLQMLASYSFSHCLDYGSQNTTQPYQRGNCDYDLRHNLTGAVSYELPDVSRDRWSSAVLSRWAVDNRFMVRTGFPVTLNGPCIVDPRTDHSECIGLNLVEGQPAYVYGSQYPGGRAINANGFALPDGCVSIFFCPDPAGPGNAPRNFVRGFGAWQMDLALRREFPLRERAKLQFRAEAFNVFNHPNFGEIDSQFGDALFGQAIRTLGSTPGALSSLYRTGGARSMQFALKFLF